MKILCRITLVSFFIAILLSGLLMPVAVPAYSSKLLGLSSDDYHISLGGIDPNGVGSTQATIPDNLNVYFIDVGQGDAILLDYGNTEVLIDGGNPSPGVMSFIQPYVQGPLDAVIATHMDADHIGGLTAVISSFTISDIWTNGDVVDTQTYRSFISAVNANPATKHTARRGNTIAVGSLTFSVQNPVNVSGTSNNNSIVLNLVFGTVSFQFEGDAETAAESSMLTAGLIHHADILKVGHHGSKTASSPAFLAALTPDVAIYMCGVNNQYGHPAPETIAALTNIGAAIYGTDVDGTIEVSTNGNSYSVNNTVYSPTSLTSSSNPSASSQSVTFSAIVSIGAIGTPTGSVTFKDGTTTVGTGTLDGTGKAIYTTSSLSVGNHSITANYGGDINYRSSTSPPLIQIINKASTTTALISSPNPSGSGQSVIFTATVSPVAPATGTPSGSVTYKDGTATIGTATLDGTGKAAYSISSLSLGSHSITAVYDGDTNFAGSSSPVLVQTVNQSSTSRLVFSPSPGESRAGTAFYIQPVVQLQDASGNIVNSSSAQVTVTITSGTGKTGAVLAGTSTVNAVNGVATFSGLSINLANPAGNSYTLTATSGSFTATSSPFKVIHPGDANSDSNLNMGDVTKVERIILGLDPWTCGSDANNDGKINMGDVTKIERIILGLDPLIG